MAGFSFYSPLSYMENKEKWEKAGLRIPIFHENNFPKTRGDDPVLAKKPDPAHLTSNEGRFSKVY